MLISTPLANLRIILKIIEEKPENDGKIGLNFILQSVNTFRIPSKNMNIK